MKSYYSCVLLTEECRAGLRAVQAALADDAAKVNLWPSGINDAHFTLSVFNLSDERKAAAESEEQLIASVNAVLKDFLEKGPSTQLTFGGLGSFGAHFVFIHVINRAEVVALRKDMNEVLQKAGLILADDRFTPHVTIFRARDGKRGVGGGGVGSGVMTVRDMVQRTDMPPVAASPVTQIAFRKLRGSRK